MVGTTDRLTDAIPGSNDNRGHDPLDRLILLAGSDYLPNRCPVAALEASACRLRFVGLVKPRTRSLVCQKSAEPESRLRSSDTDVRVGAIDLIITGDREMTNS